MAARSAALEENQDSRMRAWKEGAAWQPAALEEAKIPE